MPPARYLITNRTQVSSTPFNATGADVSLDILSGPTTINLPKANSTPGMLLEVFNLSASTVTVGLQDSGDRISRNGSLSTTVTVPAGASQLYISDGTTYWYEFRA